MSDLNPLGHEVGRLPHSRESDVAANREARFSGRQLLGLLNSGLFRLVFGLPIATFGAALAFGVTHWFFILVGLVALGFGAYLSWRGFSFLGDVITRNVSYVNGPLQGRTKTYRGRESYYMVIGPVWTQIWRRKTYEALPFGQPFNAYYASGSLHLLSVEPAAAGEPHPSLRFGGDAAHAWDRLRWPWLIAAVAVVGLVAGARDVVTAHPAQTFTVSGSLSGYYEIHGRRSSSFYLQVQGSDKQYFVNSINGLPQLYSHVGDHVDLYINSDSESDVLAVRWRNRLYTGDLYLHPEGQLWEMIISGVAITIVSVATLAGATYLIYWLRKQPPLPTHKMFETN